MTELDFLQETPASAPAPRRGLSLGSIVLLLGVAAVVVVFGLALLRSQNTQPTSGPAPQFEATTFAGETVRLADLRGQVVILNFWASWCAPCREEAPALQAIWERYRDRGVVVVGVAYADIEADSRAFIDEFAMTYPNAPDRGTRISDDYYIQGVPETFVIDQRGDVHAWLLGPSQVNVEYLSSMLDALLAESS